jgi:hypothetical protein
MPPFRGTYSKNKELLFLSPCSRQASFVDANAAHSFSVIAAMSIPCAVCGHIVDDMRTILYSP